MNTLEEIELKLAEVRAEADALSPVVLETFLEKHAEHKSALERLQGYLARAEAAVRAEDHRVRMYLLRAEQARTVKDRLHYIRRAEQTLYQMVCQAQARDRATELLQKVEG